MRFISRKLFLLFPLLLLSFATAAQTSPAGSGLDPARLARIPNRMKELVDQGIASGAVTLVARHGVIAELDAVGYRDLENKTPMTTDTIFQIMSMTKPFTGVGIMMLFEEGKLQIDDPVEKYLPEFRGQMVMDGTTNSGAPALRKPSRPVTIRDLMTHTSGVIDGPVDDIMLMSNNMRSTLAETVAEYAKHPLRFDPGTMWQYSSPGIDILGRIIEVVSGQSFEQFTAQRLFDPLGMKDSFFYAPPDKQKRVALVYHSENGKLVRSTEHILGGNPSDFRKDARDPSPGWGMYSTATDLFAFYQMMLNGGTYKGRRFLSKPSIELMTQNFTGYLPRAGWMGGGGYGLTWEVAKEAPGTLILRFPGAYGHGGAFGTQGWIDPKLDMIRIFMVQNSDGNGGKLSDPFMVMAASSISDY